MTDSAATVIVSFEKGDPTPCYPDRLAPAFFAALAAARGDSPPEELPKPTYREAAAEPYTPARWKRYTWRVGELSVSVRVEPRCSGHGVHGSDMSWTLRGASCGELEGCATSDARGGSRYAELRLDGLASDARAEVARAFRAALGAPGRG